MARVLLDQKQTAERLGMAEATLKKWRVIPPEDPLPFFKIGSRILYDAGDVDQWLARRRRLNTSQPAAPAPRLVAVAEPEPRQGRQRKAAHVRKASSAGPGAAA